jgi:predicted TIM-barrel fold metal-dependent hydrolase
MQKQWIGGTLCLLLVATALITGCGGSSEPAGDLFAGTPAPASGPGVLIPVNDAHAHFVDFTQHTDGFSVLLAKMDEAGVDHTVIFGLPVIKKWNYDDPVRPSYYNDNDGRVYYYSLTDAVVAQAYLKLSPVQRERFYPMIAGFDPTDMNAVEQIDRIMTMYPGVFVGIGEILLRHDDLSRMTADDLPRANHPALDAVYDYAARHDMPVWIHSNIGTAAYPDPIYESEVEEVLTKHPDTRIVWCHAGYSRNLNITRHPDRVRAMLKNHPNLTVDISWVVYDNVIAKDGKIDETWLQLIRDYPDRFMIGTDNIGNFTSYPANIRKYDLLFSRLDKKTRDSVAYWNLYKVLPASVKRPDRMGAEMLMAVPGEAPAPAVPA